MDFLLEHHRFVQNAAPSDLETWARDTAATKGKSLGVSARTSTSRTPKSKATLQSTGGGDKDPNEWAKKMARQYDSHLFKEFALADMTHHKTGKVGLRWRTGAEVVSGKGESECANLDCAEEAGLVGFEVNFAYIEGNPPVRKNTLVKLRLCPACGYKLNYKKTQEKVKERVKKHKRKRKKHKRSRHRHKHRRGHGNGDTSAGRSSSEASSETNERKKTRKSRKKREKNKTRAGSNSNNATEPEEPSRQ